MPPHAEQRRVSMYTLHGEAVLATDAVSNVRAAVCAKYALGEEFPPLVPAQEFPRRGLGGSEGARQSPVRGMLGGVSRGARGGGRRGRAARERNER